MGLDQYLTKKTYIGNTYARHDDNPNGFRDFVPMSPEVEALGVRSIRVTYVEEQLCYWRKANQIHHWFVENVAGGHDTNGDQHYVERSQLIELRDACKLLLDKIEMVPDMVTNGRQYNPDIGKWEPILEPGKQIANPEVAAEILPSAEGFFFGSTDYDEYYLADIKYTAEQLDAVLEGYPEGDHYEIYYHSSW